MRKTKIVCTMGPNTDKKATMKALVRHGMDVARFNFSHGDYEEQRNRMNLLKNVREELDKPVAILLDTKGPEIRLGAFKEPKVELRAGDSFTLTTEPVEGDSTIASISFAGLPADVRMNPVLLKPTSHTGSQVIMLGRPVGRMRVGEYLRYNASHKLSLYLASGMPVIVWQESGVAAFVNKNHLGLTVNSLEELPERIGKLTENEKALISEGVGIMSEKIRHGEMLRNCLKN